jgi:hypothetical protein
MSEPIDDPADLLLDYCTGGLPAEDERALLASAATNQDIFNQLMEAEVLRDAFSSAEERNRLKAALQAWEASDPPEPASGEFTRLFKTPQGNLAPAGPPQPLGGQFTRFFKTPQGNLTAGGPPQPLGPGEFTRMFGKPGNDPVADPFPAGGHQPSGATGTFSALVLQPSAPPPVTPSDAMSLCSPAPECATPGAAKVAAKGPSGNTRLIVIFVLAALLIGTAIGIFLKK